MLPKHTIELRNIAMEWCGEHGYCTYVIPGAFVNYSKEIKEVMAQPQYSDQRIAVAVFQSNLAVRLIVDLFWKLTKKKEPTRLFRTKEDALLWLRKQKDEFNIKNCKKNNIA
ncbi:MAG: hypothetical protein R2799_08460 [Crocinitomicaceae bacterium]